MKLNISVIGCGWLGLPLAQMLVSEGYQVYGSTTTQDKLSLLREMNIIPLLYNIYSTESIDWSSDVFSADIYIINIPPGRKNKDVITNYTYGINKLLNNIDKTRSPRVIYVSSTGVYANTGAIVSESDPSKPEKDSGKAVLAGEVQVMKSGLNHVILRMAGLVGGHRQPGNWFAGKKEIPGGDTPVNMVHREDCLEIIKTIISQPSISGIYNVCADKHPTKRSFYTVQSEKLGLDIPTWQSGKASHKLVSNDLLKSILGYQYIHPDPVRF